MQLSFEKQQNGEISVKFKVNETYEDFSYSKMVRKIYDEKIIEDSELIGTFSDKENDSICELINEFRNVVSELEQKAESEE